jgi:hypothetical protein
VLVIPVMLDTMRVDTVMVAKVVQEEEEEEEKVVS